MDVWNLKQELNKYGALMCFNGSMTHGIIQELGNATRQYLEAASQSPSVVTDIFAIYIEQTQNIQKYLRQKNLVGGQFARAVVVISQEEGGYAVSSGNYILREDGLDLQERLTLIQGLSSEALRKRYKEVLRTPRGAMPEGAGLGLLDMAKRASRPLDFSYSPQGDTMDFFTLTAFVAGV